MSRKIDLEIKAGIFIFVGLILSAGTILIMGGGHYFFTSHKIAYVKYTDVMGLVAGAKIRSGGIKIGRVKEIKFDENFDSVVVKMLIEERFWGRIRKNSRVRIQTQGVLGDRFLEVYGGTLDQATLEAGSMLDPEIGGGMEAIMAKGNDVADLLKDNLVNIKILTDHLIAEGSTKQMIKDMAIVAENLKKRTNQLDFKDLNATLRNVKMITEGIEKGEGTLGALLKDPSLYDDLKNLLGGANRSKVLKYVVRHAVKKSDDAKKAQTQNTP